MKNLILLPAIVWCFAFFVPAYRVVTFAIWLSVSGATDPKDVASVEHQSQILSAQQEFYPQIALFLAHSSATVQETDDPSRNVEAGKEAKHLFEYYRYLLLRKDKAVIALFVLPNPRYGKSGISYQWFRMSNEADAFENTDGWDQDNPDVTFGTGSTHDGITCLNTYPAYFFGLIEMDTIEVKWMSIDNKTGELHFLGKQRDIEVYPVQFDRLDDISKSIDQKRWRSINMKQNTKRP